MIVRQALIWLPECLGVEGRWIDPAKTREAAKLKAFEEAARRVLRHAYSFRYTVQPPELLATDRGIVEFRPGGESIFNLPGFEEPRTAVTGDALDSKVIFNLGVISDPEHFTYGDALALWIHEIGHKVKGELPDLTQKEIDELADRIGRRFAGAAKIVPFGDKKIWTLSPVTGVLEGGGFEVYMSLWQIPLGFGILEGGKFYDLTLELNRALDARRAYREWGTRNYFESMRRVINLQPLAGDKILLELRTHRRPIDTRQYFVTEIGGPYFKSGILEIGEDLGIRVESYQEQDPPAEVIDDAEAELSDLQLAEGKLTGWIKFHLSNQKHFHAMGYPTAYYDTTALLDGRPVKLETKLAIRMNRDTGGMPAEVYKREMVTEGRFSIDLSHLDGENLEITGVQSRFFTYGRFSWPDQEIKRLRLRGGGGPSFKLNCEARLQKP